jgi:hypothetical protein
VVVAVILLASLASSCSGAAASPSDRRPGDAGDINGRCWGKKVARSAQWYLANQQEAGRRDCSGLVEEILERAGTTARGSVSQFWLAAARNGRLVAEPRPGDLVFFDETWDANGNGRVDDELTHIAVVVDVDCEDTVHMVHRAKGRVRALRLNLLEPTDPKRNDFLRARGYGPKRGPQLTGELFRIFARPPRE